MKCIAGNNSDEYVMDALISLVELLLHEVCNAKNCIYCVIVVHRIFMPTLQH